MRDTFDGAALGTQPWPGRSPQAPFSGKDDQGVDSSEDGLIALSHGGTGPSEPKRVLRRASPEPGQVA